VARVTTTFDKHTLAQIRRVAGPRGVSSFLATAAKERLARLELLGLLDELDAEHGAPIASVRADVTRDARRIFRRASPRSRRAVGQSSQQRAPAGTPTRSAATRAGFRAR
jgi:hypothetical protein